LMTVDRVETHGAGVEGENKRKLCLRRRISLSRLHVLEAANTNENIASLDSLKLPVGIYRG
jgi:hypothetical protein